MANNVNHIQLEYEAKNLDKILKSSKDLQNQNETLIKLIEDFNQGLVELKGNTSKAANELRGHYKQAIDACNEALNHFSSNATKVLQKQANDIQKISREQKKAMQDLTNKNEMQSLTKQLETLRKQWQENERNMAKSRQSLLNGRKNTPIEDSYLIREQKEIQKQIEITRKQIQSLYGSYRGAKSEGSKALFHDDSAKAFTEANIKQREARDLLMQYDKTYNEVLTKIDQATEKHGKNSLTVQKLQEQLKNIVELREKQIKLLEEETTKLMQNGQLTEKEGKDVLNRLANMDKEAAQKREIAAIDKQETENEKEALKILKEKFQLENKILQLSKDEKSKNSNKNQIEELQRQVGLYNQKLQKMEQEGRFTGDIKKKIQEATEAHRNEQSAIQAKNADLEKSNSLISDTLKNFMKFTLYYAAVNKLREGIQLALDTMKDLDKAFTDIKLVTGGTVEETNQLAKEYNVLAKEMGATTVEVANGAGEWLRQGKTAEETALLLKSSMTLSKVGAIEASEATQLLTSSLNGYKIEAKDAMSVVDKISAIDLAAATSSEELAVALARTANIANDSEVSFDKLLAMIGTVSSVTRRSAETIRRSI